MLSPPMPPRPPHLTASPPLPIDSPLHIFMSDTPSAMSTSQDEATAATTAKIIERIKSLDLQGQQDQQDPEAVAAQLRELSRKLTDLALTITIQNTGSTDTDTGWRKVAAAQAQADSMPQGTDKDLLLAFCRSLGITFETLGISEKARLDEIRPWITTLDEIDKGAEVDIKKWRGQLIKSHQYFLTIDEVVNAEVAPYKPETPETFLPHIDANLFKRREAPNVDGYETIAEVKEEGIYCNKTLAASRQDSMKSNAKNSTYPCDVIGRNQNTADGAQVAHLIPNCDTKADEWADIACWAFGLDPKKTKCGVALRLLHGVTKTIYENGKQKQRRITGTGLRFSKANKLRIDHQSTLFDNDNPSLLIIPIMDVEQCKKWDGREYEAIVLLKKDKLASFGLTGNVATNVHDATYRDVTNAIDLLRQCTIVMAKSLIDKSSFLTSGKVDITREQKLRTRLIDRRTSFVEACGEKGKKSVVLPMAVEEDKLDLKYKGVCKIKFSNCRHGPVETQNPAPDPLILLARASVVWSVMSDMRLRASAEPRPDDNNDDSNDLGALKPLPADYPLPSPLKKLQDNVPSNITAGTEDALSVSTMEPNSDDDDNDISFISSSSFTE